MTRYLWAGLLISLVLLGGAVFVGYNTVRQLLRPTPAATSTPEVRITIPEGWRREQIAALLEARGIVSSKEFLEKTKDLEGRLFPDTYFFLPKSDVGDVVETFTSTFRRRTGTNPPTEEQLILASIIEREAANDGERRRISGVYTNRLRIGMKLDADPTVQYGKVQNMLDAGEKVADLWPTITRADYQQVNSPFNTYRNAGLPPSPIANPGLKSIRAAAEPETHDYLYFVHRNGELRMAKTLGEHEVNARRNP